MEREAIKKLLPHREPMLLLDTVDATPSGGMSFSSRGIFRGGPSSPE